MTTILMVLPMLDVTTSMSSLQPFQPFRATSVTTTSVSDIQTFQPIRALPVTTSTVPSFQSLRSIEPHQLPPLWYLNLNISNHLQSPWSPHPRCPVLQPQLDSHSLSYFSQFTTSSVLASQPTALITPSLARYFILSDWPFCFAAFYPSRAMPVTTTSVPGFSVRSSHQLEQPSVTTTTSVVTSQPKALLTSSLVRNFIIWPFSLQLSSI